MDETDLKLSYGRDRIVIIDNIRNIVIKVARNENGLTQNFNEFTFNKKRPDITARVLEYHGEILIMEYVEKLPNLQYESGFKDKDNPTKEEVSICEKWWIVFNELSKELGDSSDNAQIGTTKDGRIVAYDYGHTEKFIEETANTLVKQNDEFLKLKSKDRSLLYIRGHKR